MRKTPKSELESSEITTLRLSSDTKHSLQKLAQQDNRTFSNYVRLVLEKHVREAEAAPQPVAA